MSLSPLGWLYGTSGKFLRLLASEERFPIPLMSVGNIVSGGSGKTPTALALATLLQEHGHKVCFVTRGYKGKKQGPLKVSPDHTAFDVGDEALLLAQQAPTWMGKDRRLAIRRACEEMPDLIILDDGHQTTGLYKDLSFVVVDGLQGFGNGCVIPAGPLRETATEGLKRADAVIAIGALQPVGEKKNFSAQLMPQPLSSSLHRGVAFCGLGFPQKFFKTLEGMGIELVSTVSFPDHHPYTEADLLGLRDLAERSASPLLTTRKDWVKLPPSWQKEVYVLDITIQFDQLDALYAFILSKITHLRPPHA